MAPKSRAFASPHVIAQSKLKQNPESGSHLAPADDDIAPIQMSNDRQVTKAIQSIVSSYTQSKDWDEQLEAVKHAIAIVRGGGPNFISFVHQADKFTPLISECVVNFRSSLVRFSCLLAAELAEKLAQQYAFPALTLIPILFKPTQSATQIVADSCRVAILAIARCVQSKKVLQAFIEANISKSSVQREIVANSIFLIVTNWEKECLNECFQMLERILVVLVADPAPLARQFARDGLRSLSEIFPDKKDRLFAQLDSRTKSSFQSETHGHIPVKPARRSASVDSSVRRRRVEQKSNFSETMVAHGDSAHLSEVQQWVLQGETQRIIEYGPGIAQSLVAAMDESNPTTLVRAFEITADVIHLITDAFREHLPSIFAALFKPVPRAEHHSKRLLGRLTSLFTASDVFHASLTTADSIPLLHYVTELLGRTPNLLDTSVSERLLSLCLFVCLECRRDESSMKEAIFLLTAIHDQFPTAYQSFVASAKPEIQQFLSKLQLTDPEEDSGPPIPIVTEEVLSIPPKPTISARIRQTVGSHEEENLQAFMVRLQNEPDKSPIIRSISAMLIAAGGTGLGVALPHLIRLSKGKFATDIERALQAIGSKIDSPVILDATIPLLGEEEPELFIEFLTRVVAAASKEVLVPRTGLILGRLAPLLHHQVPIVRKDSVLCIVELRIVIGQEFDREIAALKSLPRKLVLHYLERRLGGTGK
jgi:hypothetical protein